MAHLLDNPAWSALTGGNRNLAQGTEQVKHYPADVAPFAGLAETTPANFQTLYDITPGMDAGFAVVTTEKTEIPAPWKIAHCLPLFQMVCETPVQRKEAGGQIRNLSDEHIPQMIALAKLTNPGPFRERTIDFGHYQGIFDETRLVAMAGQRMHAPPYAEISAVCTHPDYTGRGYAAQLMVSQIGRLKEAGETPFLHVAAINERAIKLYGFLGFVIRKDLFIYFIKK
jgi:predicted GNAT family acetyltransferase